jgi:4-amino-4-deoxy-L-arabinose transferase-like glycosyltransferase
MGVARFSDWLSHSIAFQNAIALVMILLFAGLNFISVQRGFSLTTDEDKHYLYGSNIIAGDSNRIDDSKMPATALNAIPSRIASFLEDGLVKRFLGKYYMARSVTIFFACLLAFLVYAWARRLYGFPAALFSLVLFVWDPNIMAHSQLVTNDLYVTAGIALTFHTLWRFANNRTWRNGLLFSTALGVSQLAKYSALVLFPLTILALFLYDSRAWWNSLRDFGKFRAMAGRYLLYGVCALFVVIVITNAGFLFNRTFTPFGEFTFRSDVFSRLSIQFPALNSIPVPVPYPYLHGLDWMRNTETTGNLSGNVYLLGQVSPLEGFPGYYFVAYLLKVPIATQIFILAALAAYFMHKERREKFLRDEVFLLTPVAFFFIYFNFFFNTQIGIRYLLPVFPLLYVFAANLFIPWNQFPPVKKGVSLVLIAYLVVSVLSYHPYYLSYFNEIVWDRRDAYKYLADSNLDWSQAKNELKLYLEEYPGALYSPNNVRPGRLVVRVNDLVGVTEDPGKYAWLRDNFEPVETIAYAYLVYKIEPEEIDKLCSTTSYCDN